MTTPEPTGTRYVAGGVMLSVEDAYELHVALATTVAELRTAGFAPTPTLEAIRGKFASALKTGVSVSGLDRDTLARVSKWTEVPGLGASSDRDHLIGTDTAAELLGCTVSNVRDLARRGILPGRSVGGRWLVDRVAVEERAARR